MNDVDTYSNCTSNSTQPCLESDNEKEALRFKEINKKIEKCQLQIQETQKKREENIQKFLSLDSTDKLLYDRMRTYFEQQNERTKIDIDKRQIKLKKYKKQKELLEKKIIKKPRITNILIKNVNDKIKHIQRSSSADNIIVDVNTVSKPDKRKPSTLPSDPSTSLIPPPPPSRSSESHAPKSNEDEYQNHDHETSSLTNESGQILISGIDQKNYENIQIQLSSLVESLTIIRRNQEDTENRLKVMETKLHNIDYEQAESIKSIQILHENVSDISSSFNQFKNSTDEIICQIDFKLGESVKDMHEKITHNDAKITTLEQKTVPPLPNNGYSKLMTKVVNILLAFVTVILVLISMVATLTGPLLSTKFRTFLTIVCVGIIAVSVQHWEPIKEILLKLYRQHLASRMPIFDNL